MTGPSWHLQNSVSKPTERCLQAYIHNSVSKLQTNHQVLVLGVGDMKGGTGATPLLHKRTPATRSKTAVHFPATATSSKWRHSWGTNPAFQKPISSIQGPIPPIVVVSCVVCALQLGTFQWHLAHCAQLTLKSCNRERRQLRCGSQSPGWSSSPKSCNLERHDPQCGSQSPG